MSARTSERQRTGMSRRFRLLRLLPILLIACDSCGGSLSGEETRPISLEAAIDLAKSESRELAFIRSDRELAKERLWMEARKFFPQLAVSFSKNDSVTYGSPDSRYRSIGLSLTQLLYDRGQLLQRYRQHRHELSISSIAARQAAEQIALAVTDEFITLLVLEESLEILRTAAAALERQVGVAERERSLGLTTGLEVMDIRMSLADLSLEISSTDRRRERSRIVFSRLLNADPDSGLVPGGGIVARYRGFLLDSGSDTRELRNRLFEDARINNTDLLAAANRFESALQAKRQADLAWIPELKATAEITMSGDRFPLTEPGYRLGLDIAFGIPAVPISAGTAIGKAAPRERSLGLNADARPMENLESLLTSRAASLELGKADMSKEETEQELHFRIRDLISEISHMRAVIDLDREKLEIARTRLEILHERARLGEARRMEVAEAELAIARQRSSILEAAADLYRTELSLLMTAGVSDIAKTVGFIVSETGGPE